MKTTNFLGHMVHHQAIIFGQFYLFATDVEGTVYMIKVLEDGSLEIL